MSFQTLSDQAVAKILGERLSQLRLERNFTQQYMGEEIGLSRLSYRKLEAGEGKLVNFVAALRVLGRVEALELVLPQETFSPMQQLQLQRKARKRASAAGGSDHTSSEIENGAKNKNLDW